MSLEALAAVNASVDELSKGDVAAEKIVITPEDISVIMILAIRRSLKLVLFVEALPRVDCTLLN